MQVRHWAGTTPATTTTCTYTRCRRFLSAMEVPDRKKERGVTVVEELTELSKDWNKLVNNPLMSDVSFIVGTEKKRIYGHKVILAARSKPLQVLLFGGMKESKEQDIRIKDIEPEVRLDAHLYTF